MVKFNQISQLATFKNKSPRRKGRGIAAGLGKTAGRGTKGQKSRSGGSTRPYFEGGQTPLIRKLPKLAGFRSFRPARLVVYSGQLDSLKTSSKIIDNHVLYQAGLIKDGYSCVKLIKKGSIKKAHQVHLQAISAAAQADLIKAGGSFKMTARPQRPKSIKKEQRGVARQQTKSASRLPNQKSANKSKKVVK